MNSKNTFYVYDFDTFQKSDSEIIKLCLKASESLSERIIVFDRRDWHIDEAILLPSETTVIIDGCSIIQNDEVYDNVFRGNNLVLSEDKPYEAPLSVLPLKNVKILGKNGAKIIGCEKNRFGYHTILKETQEMVGDFWGWRTLQISLSMCKNFEIGNLQFERSRCWTMSFDICQGGYIHDLQIKSNVKNGDGIDIRLGSHNFVIENITGFTSDDTVACTALPPHDYPLKNYQYPLEPANNIAKGITDPDIHDITIRNIKTGGHHHGVICLAAGGLKVYNITIENVDEDTEGERESAVRIYTGYGNGYNDNDLHNISVKGVTCRISKFAVLCNTKVKDVHLSKLSKLNEGDELVSIINYDGITIV